MSPLNTGTVGTELYRTNFEECFIRAEGGGDIETSPELHRTMGNSSSTHPTLRIELSQSTWKAGETVSGRVIVEQTKEQHFSNIRSLRIQFCGKEQVSLQLSRVEEHGTQGLTERDVRHSEREREVRVRVGGSSPSRSPRHRHERLVVSSAEGSLREPLLDHGYQRTVVESDRGTSGGPTSPRPAIDHQSRPQRRREQQTVSVPSENGDRVQRTTPSRNNAFPPREQLQESPMAESRSRSDMQLREERQVNLRSNRSDSRQEFRAQINRRRDDRARKAEERLERREQRRLERSQAHSSAVERRVARPETARRHVHRANTTTGPELQRNRPSYRQVDYIETATHTICESDSLLVDLRGRDSDSWERPFEWTLPADAPSSFHWHRGSSSAQVVYHVAVYCVTESGETVGRVKQEFNVDTTAATMAPLVVQTQDLPVVGCCSNKGLVRMGLRGTSQTAVKGQPLSLEVNVDDSECRGQVVCTQVSVSESVRLRTAQGGDDRHTRSIVQHTTRGSANQGMEVAIPWEALPTYNGRWVTIHHTLAITAKTKGCCTNDPEVTTAVVVVTGTTAARFPVREVDDNIETAAPMATVIPEATIVSVVPDDNLNGTNSSDDKALSQPPDLSSRFNATAPDESIAIS